MQGEDDLRGLAKIIAFMRAVSIILVLMHLYWFCYGFFMEIGWTLPCNLPESPFFEFEEALKLV